MSSPDSALRRMLAMAVVAMLLTACAVGPEYTRPELDVPTSFAHADGRLQHSQVEPEFWATFDDPVLDTLVAQALAANHELRIAAARLERARAGLRLARADLFPTVTARVEAADVQLSQSEAPDLSRADRQFERYELGAEAFWELDLFGRVRRGVQSQHAEAEASAADLGAAQVAVVSELASRYFELRGLQAQLAVARENAGNQARTLELVSARLEAGRGTEFDSARAAGLLEGTRATIPALEAAVAANQHAMAVLVGQAPTALSAQLAAPRALPQKLPVLVPVGTPADLLRRRPDVAAAERRLAAATARVGVVAADLFPRLTLGGLIGSQALDTDALFEGASERRVVALGIDWSFLDVGRVRARIATAEAGADENLARYQQTVLRALQQAETALARYAAALREHAHRAEAARASRRASDLAQVRFEGGAADLLEVLDAERSRLAAEDERVRSQVRTATALVELYRALAGGWPQHAPSVASN